MSLSSSFEILDDYVREEASRRDYQLLDINFKGRNPLRVEIVLDKKGGITLDECGDFNRNITGWIDENEVFKCAYSLDVCSPGLDRELKTDRDYVWAAGKEVKITTLKPVSGRNEITGILSGKNESGKVQITDPEGNEIIMDPEMISKVKLEVNL